MKGNVFKDVFLCLIQLACQLTYFYRQVNWIKFTKTSLYLDLQNNYERQGVSRDYLFSQILLPCQLIHFYWQDNKIQLITIFERLTRSEPYNAIQTYLSEHSSETSLKDSKPITTIQSLVRMKMEKSCSILVVFIQNHSQNTICSIYPSS